MHKFIKYNNKLIAPNMQSLKPTFRNTRSASAGYFYLTTFQQIENRRFSHIPQASDLLIPHLNTAKKSGKYPLIKQKVCEALSYDRLKCNDNIVAERTLADYIP